MYRRESRPGEIVLVNAVSLLGYSALIAFARVVGCLGQSRVVVGRHVLVLRSCAASVLLSRLLAFSRAMAICHCPFYEWLFIVLLHVSMLACVRCVMAPVQCMIASV